MIKYVFEVEEEMTRCYKCPMLDEEIEMCLFCEKGLSFEEVNIKKPKWCPLKEIDETVCSK